jgi:hypothetical protein
MAAEQGLMSSMTLSGTGFETVSCSTETTG